jgi:hypothetical protein
MDEQPTMEWRAFEYTEKERSTDWFWAFGIIAVSSAVIAILYKDYLFGIFIILAAIILGFMAIRKPELETFRITPKALELGNDTYAYTTLKSFHILEKDNEESVLLVMSTRAVIPLIPIPLGDASPSEVRETLRHYLPEDRHEEPTAHKIMDYLGF